MLGPVRGLLPVHIAVTITGLGPTGVRSKLKSACPLLARTRSWNWKLQMTRAGCAVASRIDEATSTAARPRTSSRAAATTDTRRLREAVIEPPGCGPIWGDT